ncbi:MAG: hypothetical protein L0H94_00010 [Nitrospira sp.]|nr:hypothetical protein [Nitrospira sp.]
MSLRLLLTIAGGFEILAGSAALIVPAPVVSLLFGLSMDPIASILARLFGAGVFALGLACLKARYDVGSLAGLARAEHEMHIRRGKLLLPQRFDPATKHTVGFVNARLF